MTQVLEGRSELDEGVGGTSAWLYSFQAVVEGIGMANVTCVVSASLLKLGNSGEGEVRVPVRKRRDEDLIAGSIVGCGSYNHIVSGRSDSTVPYLSNTLTSLGSAFRRTGPNSLVPSNLGQVGEFDATLLFLGVGNALGHSATPATRSILEQFRVLSKPRKRVF